MYMKRFPFCLLSCLSWLTFSQNTLCQTIEHGPEVRREETIPEEVGKEAPELGKQLPRIAEPASSDKSLPAPRVLEPKAPENRAPNQESTVVSLPIQPEGGTVVTKPEAQESSVSDTLLNAWQSPGLKNELPAIRFSQAAQRIDLLATLANLKIGTVSTLELENSATQNNIQNKYDTLKQLDAALKKMSDDALDYAKKLSVGAGSEKIITTSVTIAALAGIRQDIAREQRKAFENLKTIGKIRTNRVRPVLEKFTLTAQDFSSETALENKVNPQITTLQQDLASINANIRKIVQTAGLTVILPEVDALNSFVAKLDNLKQEIDARVDAGSFEGDAQKLIESGSLLDALKKSAEKVSTTLKRERVLYQSRTFTIKVNEFFMVLKKFLEFISTKVTGFAEAYEGLTESGRVDAEGWKQIAGAIGDPANKSQIQDAYTQFETRLDELENYITVSTQITDQLAQKSALTTDDRQILGALRRSMEGYLSSLSASAQMIGVRIDNPTALGSHLLTFVSSWYRPTGESVTADDVTLAQNASEGIGASQAIIKRLESQGASAGDLLRIIDGHMIRQASIASKALYGFSFVGTILANTSGALAWVQTAAVKGLESLGSPIDLKYQKLLLPLPILAMGASVIFEALAYAAQKGALKLAGG